MKSKLILGLMVVASLYGVAVTPPEDPISTSPTPIVESAKTNVIKQVQPLKVEPVNVVAPTVAPKTYTNTTTTPKVPVSNASAPNGTYTNTYGNEVPRPYYAPSIPVGASAKCRDGSYSFSQSRRGTCSHHGGVSTWY